MGDTTFWYILGGVAALYLAILIVNRRQRKRRKDRKFMDSRRRYDS